LGSPLRLLRQLRAVQGLQGWSSVRVVVHLFDADPQKVAALRQKVAEAGVSVPDVEVLVEAQDFRTAFAGARAVLTNPDNAKLVLIDQFGVEHVSDEAFKALVGFPTCDVLFFISSSTLHRFRDHPAIKQKIKRPDDYYHVHLAVLDYYRSLLPDPAHYFLAPFSIKKGANIYGLIFGSAHPLGMDKFLQVAWKTDEINGEADFDINRENFVAGQGRLFPPTKVAAFEEDLERAIRSDDVHDEAGVVRICFRHGVKPQHAKPVLARLKAERVIECAFQVPQVDRLKNPRPLKMLSGEGKP
jgi:three-Cys-motif partner protein